MPIFTKGYAGWEGALAGRALRWLTIARWGVRLSGRSKWLRRLVLAAWLPLLYYVLVFFAVGQFTQVETLERAQGMWQFQVLRGVFSSDLAEAFIAEPGTFRPMIWAVLLHFFMHWTQIFLVMLVVAVVGPKLISQDLQSRSFAIYFAKPLTRLDYLLGKLGVVAFWVGMVTLAPALVLYALSIVFSPTLETLAQTWVVVPKIGLFSLLLMLGTGAPMLALSSLTPNARFLGFLWAGLWVMSTVASTILKNALFPSFGRPLTAQPGDWTGLVSFSKNFDAVAFRLFDLEQLLAPAAELSGRVERWTHFLSYGHDWRWSLLIILGVSALSLAVVAWRIGSPGEGGAR